MFVVIIKKEKVFFHFFLTVFGEGEVWPGLVCRFGHSIVHNLSDLVSGIYVWKMTGKGLNLNGDHLPQPQPLTGLT